MHVIALPHQEHRPCLIQSLRSWNTVRLNKCVLNGIAQSRECISSFWSKLQLNHLPLEAAYFIHLHVSFWFLGIVLPHFWGECHCSALVQWFCIVAHGNWSPWSGWGICSRSCNGGQMRRYRTCDNPHPSNGGRACGGPDSQIQRCNTDPCPGELPDSWQ